MRYHYHHHPILLHYIIILLLSYLQADMTKRVFNYKDRAEWLKGSGHGVKKASLVKIKPDNIFWVNGPKLNYGPVRIENYLNNMYFSQVFLISNLTFNQGYQVMLLRSAMTPAEARLDIIPAYQLREMLRPSKTLDKTFYSEFDKLADAKSENSYTVGIVLYHYDSIVMVNSKKGKMNVDYQYLLTLDPLRLSILTPEMIGIIHLGIACVVVAYFFAIPNFQSLLLQPYKFGKALHQE